MKKEEVFLCQVLFFGGDGMALLLLLDERMECEILLRRFNKAFVCLLLAVLFCCFCARQGEEGRKKKEKG